jgi:hypothetical protein
MTRWRLLAGGLSLILNTASESKVLEEFPVTRADSEVTAPYPALFFWNVVCVTPDGTLHPIGECQLDTKLPPTQTLSAELLRLSFNCGMMYSAAAYRWRSPPAKSVLIMTEDSDPNLTTEQYASIVADCGSLAAALAEMPPDLREYEYFECGKLSRHLGHCWVYGKTSVGYVVGFGLYQPTLGSYDKPWSPDAGQLLPNTVCIEADREAHPVSECPDVPLKKINDCVFHARGEGPLMLSRPRADIAPAANPSPRPHRP